MSEWITEPAAIETLLGLKEIRPGDEVILQDLPDKAPPPGLIEWLGRPVTVIALDGEYEPCSEDTEYGVRIRIQTPHGTYMPHSKRIKAWRRPCRDG